MSQAIAVHSRSSSRAWTGTLPTPSLARKNAAHVAEVSPGTLRGPTLTPVAAPTRRRLQMAIEYVRRIAQAIHQRWQRACTESALRELDARALRDIGLDRSEIASMAAESHGAVPASRIRVIRYSAQAVHS